MKINNLTICNFGSFENAVSFDFSLTDKNRNVILIGGRNGSGKTTIFTAIKLALYGHLAFGYKSITQSYLDQIRINNNSLSKKNLISYIELSVELEEERHVATYMIRREWKFKRKQLGELTTILRDSVELSNDEVLYFENYIKNVMPPQLFDLFFFDGELIGNFFMEGNVSKKIKESLNILKNYDTFDIIQTHLQRNIIKLVNTDSSAEESLYLSLCHQEATLKQEIEQLTQLIQSINNQIDTLSEQRSSVDNRFKNAGGLKALELSELKASLIQEERFREEKHDWLRSFANDTLPFLMVSPLIAKLKEQLDKEEYFKQYKVITEILNPSLFASILRDELSMDLNLCTISESLAHKLANGVMRRIRPPFAFNINDFTPIHDLSPDTLKNIRQLIDNIEHHSVEEIRSCKEAIRCSLENTTRLRQRLEVVEGNDEISLLAAEVQSLDEQIHQLKEHRLELTNTLQTKQVESDALKPELKRCIMSLTKVRKEKSMVSLCLRTQMIINELIPELLAPEVTLFRESFWYIFNQLMSKNTLADEVYVSKDFDVTLYRNELKSINEIRNILSKLGLDGFETVLGSRCIAVLCDKLKLQTPTELENRLKSCLSTDNLLIPIKVDINSLSKGEQQIYIMALYWSLIKVANKSIPFVIDTPYARIDKKHRQHITTQFFPTLSHQVIILSTDSEINEEYYALLKPFIAKEYTLCYSEKQKNTVTEERYFFEVTA
ncbi:AAA family ATPase [Heliobacterium gestii]|uniref:Nuclease SbcCD subunit C n=1 Tax=Heliomicrobium gestii TaxID=2699 RepID=A0A845L6S6_HELGE|nr:AAA family ATPase [Heliomicrobium gestii]MBM7865679.1 DNA sulfur modification protein DndD [Heliomicrobium gestii]MZP41928.1 AAA family ATPase [Heliomicrobium gestii]